VSRFSRLVIVESCLVPPLKLSLRVLEVRSFTTFFEGVISMTF
jgi:hypothetical protein